MAEFMVTDEDREESIIERRDRERAENGKVDNDETIPLIPNVKLDVRRTIHEIQVWKVDPPGDGFKGAVAPHTTIPGIAKLFGNGVYDFHAHSQDGKILRRNSGVKISWLPPAVAAPEKGLTSSGGEASMDLLRWQAEQHRRDTDRVESFGRMVVDSTRETSTRQLEHQARQQDASTARDRDFFAGMIAQQQTFFQNMMAMTNQAHEHARERAREDFHQTIQLIHTTNERANKASDPTLLLGLFERGLALGTGLNEGDDEPDENATEPWVQAIQAGASAIKDISDVAKIKAIAQPKLRQNLASRRPTTERPLPASTPAPSEPISKPAATPPAPSESAKRKLPFARSELIELVALKRIMDQKGLDFTATLRNASEYFAGGGAVDEIESDEGDSDSAESPSGEDADNAESAHVEN